MPTKISSPAPVDLDALLRPTGTIAETHPRADTSLANVALLSSQRLQIAAIALQAGDVASTITIEGGTTLLAGGNHAWACLIDSGRVVRAVSADDTSASWGVADVSHAYPMVSPYTVPASGLFYIGVLFDATTVPSLRGTSSSASIYATNAPQIAATGATGLTTPYAVETSLGAFTGSGNRFYARIS